MTWVTWEPTTDMVCEKKKKKRANQKIIKPERLPKNEIREWEVTARFPASLTNLVSK